MQANQVRSWQSTPNPNTSQDRVPVKVKPQGWITKGEKVIYAIVAIAIIIFGVFMVSLSSSTDTMNRELQSLENSVQHQKIANEGLEFQVKELSRPERIISIAESNGLQIQNSEVRQAQVVDGE